MSTRPISFFVCTQKGARPTTGEDQRPNFLFPAEGDRGTLWITIACLSTTRVSPFHPQVIHSLMVHFPTVMTFVLPYFVLCS
jgi:hypothetical protein